MKKRLLSLVSCALIACNIFSTISYAEEPIDSSIEVTESVSEETEMAEVDTTVEVEEPQLEENNTEIIETEEAAKEKADLESEKKDSTEETIVDVSAEEEDNKETYTVSFIDSVDDAVFAEYDLESGESVIDLPVAPKHEGYDFVEYKGNYTDVICDEEVIAVYEPIADENNLIFKELELDMAGYLITVAGKMPKNTELYVKQIESKEAEEAIKTELDIAFEAQVSFDIKLMSEGKQYQPTEYDETVSVSIKGVNTTEALEVYRITDDGAVTDMSASNIDETVKFDTDHFTTYTVGTVEYQSMSSGTYFGMKYEYYDTDSDGKEDLVVVTGEQTTPIMVRFSDREEEKAYREKYVNDNAYVCVESSDTLEFTDMRNTSNAAPWIEKESITKVHFKDVKLLNAYSLFAFCRNLEEIILENVDTTECVDMGLMFSFCTNLSKLEIISPLNTENVRKMDEMFFNCRSLKTLDGEHNFNGSNGLFTDTSKVESFDSMFWDAIELESIDLSCIDGTSAQTMKDMFDVSGAGSYGHESKLKTIKLPNNLKLAPDVTRMFAYNVRLENILNTSNWDTSRVTTMDNMFFNCFALKELNVSTWDVSNVTNIRHIFDRCESLQVLDVSAWDVSKVTDMSGAFSSLNNVTVLDVSNWNTSSCQKMEDLFWCSEKVTVLDVSNWDVSKVKNMDRMFTSCKNLKYLDISNWDVSSVEEFGNHYSTHIFQYCDNLTVIDMFRTDVVKEEAGIPSVPSKDIGYHSVHGPNYMYIDDNKDGKADSVYEKYTVFKKDSVSHRYIFDNYPEYPENSIDNLKSKYEFLYLIEPSDSPEAYGPHPDDVAYGKMIRKGPYLVENLEIVETRILDDTDPKNATGRAYLYTLNIDGDIVKALAGDTIKYRGADGTYGTEDDEVYWEIAPIKYYLWASYISDGYTLDEKYEMHKNYIKYKTNEVVTLSKEDWDYKVANTQELYYEASSFRLAKFRLTLQNEEGETLYSDYVDYEDDISSILEQYGSKWLDTEGNTVNVTTMPLESLTLRLGHIHVGAPAVEENRVNPTHTSSGHYDSVVYCKDCGAELNREEIVIPATEHNPGKAVEENKVEPTCTEPGHYDSVVYCEDDGAELTRTRIDIEPLGHVYGTAVKENVVEATEDAEGSYEEVVYCTHCHEELSRETRSIAKVEKNIPETPSNDNKDDSGETKPENKPIDSENNESGNPSPQSNTDKVEPETIIIDEADEESTEENEEDNLDIVNSVNNGNITVSTSYGGSGNISEDNLEYKTVDIVAFNESNQLHEVDLSSRNEANDDVNPKQAFTKKVIKAVVVTVAATGTSGGLLFVFIWFRRRKVRGKILSKDGVKYSNCRVTLEGRDSLNTRSNRDGEFIFRNLKKGAYILSVFNEREDLIFSCELFTGIKDEKARYFNVIENNAIAYQFGRTKENYFVDILA